MDNRKDSLIKEKYLIQDQIYSYTRQLKDMDSVDAVYYGEIWNMRVALKERLGELDFILDVLDNGVDESTFDKLYEDYMDKYNPKIEEEEITPLDEEEYNYKSSLYGELGKTLFRYNLDDE